MEAANANLKSELDAIRTACSISTWANTLFKSNVKPSLEMMNVVTAAKIETKDQASRSASMLVFGLPLSKAKDEAKRNADDKARVFEIIKTLPPVGGIAYETTRFKSSSASKPPPVLQVHNDFIFERSRNQKPPSQICE